jgi:hypothetical protein
VITWLKKLVSGIDNETPDIARISIAASVPVFLGLAIYATIKTHNFDYLGFGGGFATLVGGISVAIGLKAKTEPGEKDGPR